MVKIVKLSKTSLSGLRNALCHTWARIIRSYYVEDFVRVYPGGIAFDSRGDRHAASQEDLNNYLNHQKFYRFGSQFARGAKVADIGCGSGHGCDIVKKGGAALVKGSDMSRSAVTFAKENFAAIAEFEVQSITDLEKYANNEFDLTLSSEVLEHIKEYGKEREAVNELKRITRPGGLIVIGTPNSELLDDHGFYFEEMRDLMSGNFKKYLIFENALLPNGDQLERWHSRLAKGNTGVVISQGIIEAETVMLPGHKFELKSGIPAGTYPFGHLSVNTTLLHNTHSWIVLAIKD
jgi:2-polyprenyl-3-methyl-5-hydroxy-6-metoxy-1,4-benzoquinol methylase